MVSAIRHNAKIQNTNVSNKHSFFHYTVNAVDLCVYIGTYVFDALNVYDNKIYI